MLTGPSFLSTEKIRERYSSFDISDEIRAFIYWGLACVWMVSILITFIKSYKKINLLDYIINNPAYIPLFFIGLFWNLIAASARMLNGHNEFFISAVAFGIVWLIGMLIFNLYLKNNILVRNLIFISFGFLLELGAGIWMNPALKAGMPVSVYFIALAIGGISGFAIANFIKNRNTKIAV